MKQTKEQLAAAYASALSNLQCKQDLTDVDSPQEISKAYIAGFDANEKLLGDAIELLNDFDEGVMDYLVLKRAVSEFLKRLEGESNG